VGVRLVMILPSARGQTAGATAEVLGCDASTVRRWIHRYNQHGIAGLCD
jgi:transposase